MFNNFKSISNNKVYSKYNAAYDHKLGNFALRAFVKSLKHRRKVIKPKFIEELARKYPYEDENVFSHPITSSTTKRFNKSKDLFFKINNKENVKTKSNNKDKKPNLTINIKKPIEIDLSPNPCSYNPKYDLIFRRIPVATIYKSPKKNKDKSLLRKIKLKKIINQANETNDINNRTHQVNINKKKLTHLILNEKKNESFSKTSGIINNEKSKIVISNEDKNKKELSDNCDKDENKIIKKINNMHTLNKINKKYRTTHNSKTNLAINGRETIFSIIRADTSEDENIKRNRVLKYKFNNNSRNKSNESNSNNELKGIVDFSKMSERNFIILNDSFLKTPSFYRYEPKFDYITKNTRGFNFGLSENKNNYERKKYLLKKMMCSYGQLSKEYCLIDNSKLIKKIEK